MEIFKVIKGYEGLYEVSNLGRVKSLPKGNGNGNRERILKNEICVKNHTSYNRVSFSKNGVVKRFLVHRLVAIAFIPNLYNKPAINHIDNNGLNNSIDNLEWVTLSENMIHSAKQGRQDLPRKLGGINSGAIKTKIAIEDGSEYIGKVFGELTVIRHFLDTSLQKPRYRYECECSCGEITTKAKHKLLYSMQMCKKCAYKFSKHNR